ncbi:MAG: alpha/beta hydrolase [Eubacterium sp.]|nr:alpha/beta hydrolase [Eubacterium sp.]
MAKTKGNKPDYSSRAKHEPTAEELEQKAATGKKRRNVSRHSVIIMIFVAVALVCIFVGRWTWSIMNGYYGAFIDVDYNAETAMGNARGLIYTDEESAVLECQKEWDEFKSSRLWDEVDITSSQDGASLHGYLYNDGASETVVYLPRFYEDGTTDFLAASDLYEASNCNVFIPDARCVGKSEGEYFSWGYNEKYDLADWLSYLNGALGEQEFTLVGEGVGANTILFAASAGSKDSGMTLDGELLSPYNVRAIIAISPYESLYELAKTNLYTWYTLPSFPFLNSIVWKTNHSDCGFGVDDTALANASGESGGGEEIPTCILTSDNDEYVSSDRCREVYALYNGSAQIFSTGGTHLSIWPNLSDDVLEWLATL